MIAPKPFAVRETYSTGEVAILLGCSIQTIIRAVDAREIPAHKLPGSKRRRVRHEELLRYLEGREGFGFAVKRLKGGAP